MHGPFRWHNLNITEDIPIAKAIALSATNDFSILTNRVKIRDVLEPYANWGIKELYKLINKPGDKKLNMASILLQEDH